MGDLVPDEPLAPAVRPELSENANSRVSSWHGLREEDHPLCRRGEGVVAEGENLEDLAAIPGLVVEPEVLGLVSAPGLG